MIVPTINQIKKRTLRQSIFTKPDYEFKEDTEFEARAKKKAGIKTRNRKQNDPEYVKIMKANMKKEAEQKAPQKKETNQRITLWSVI